MSLPSASLVQMGNTNMFLDENDGTVASESTEETQVEETAPEVEAPATEEEAPTEDVA